MSDRQVLGTCHHDCPDSCGWVVTVRDGVAGSLRGNPDHPFSAGELCPKVNRFLERAYSPDRVRYPMRRQGPKGGGSFVRCTWEEAMELVAERVGSAIDRHGGSTVLPWWDAGNQSALSMDGLHHRLFDRLGATALTGSLCGGTARAGVAATNGTGRGMDPMELCHSRLILLWGTNTRLTNRHLWPTIEAARARGATVVCIDPVRTVTAAASDHHLQPLPGTDVALMLAMMHVLVRDDLVDVDYVHRHTAGFDELAAHVRHWSPQRAAEICGVDAAEIETVARWYGTVRPAAIRTLIGAEHREHGAMVFRTMACLPLLVGAWRDRGGGLARSTGSITADWIDDSALSGVVTPDPGRRAVNMNHLGRALTDDTLDPPVTALFVWNGNPLVSVPNAELIRRGLERDDLFTVVHEQFVTDTARYADLLLPATTQIEQLDVVAPWGHLYLGLNRPAIEPVGESVPNTELFRRLAGALGIHDELFGRSDEELLEDALATLSPEQRSAMHRDGFVRVGEEDPYLPFAHGGFGFADGRARLHSPELAAAGLDALPTYRPAQEAPTGSLGADGRHPLVLLTPKTHTRFLNSSYTHLPGHGDREGGPVVELDPADAAARQLAEGDLAHVSNDRGSLTLPVRISDRLRPGVAAIPFGWWRNGDGAANSLTSDTLTDWGGGVAYHDTLVQVRPAAAPPA